MLIVAIFMIRLRWYELVAVSDMKHGRVRVEDFSIYLPDIPIGKEDYNNSPELLQAMIATHFEEIVGSEL